MYNTKTIIKNAFRISKVRGESAIRIRVPGGHLEAKHLDVIRELAEKFGNGTVHLTTRQGYEVPGIKLADLPAIKRYMARMIFDIEKMSGLILEGPEAGYVASGSRNVSACIGNRVCSFANADTTALAQKIEKEIYPNDLHLKVAVTGCPNDCIKAHMNDIGIIATVKPGYSKEKCIACEACIDVCRERVTNALYLEDYKIVRDEDYCIKCGECILKCPTGAQFREKRFFRILFGGRTGKRNPRLAVTFIEDAVEEVALGLVKNIFLFAAIYKKRDAAKEHMGYIVDRAGYEVFKREVLEGVRLNDEARVAKRLDNPGYKYPVRPH